MSTRPGSPLALDAETMRRLGYRTVDMLVDRLLAPPGPVVHSATPKELRERLALPPPESPVAFDEILDDLEREVLPHGGYRDIEVPPWIPIGVTGVVRRAERNSTVVVAEPGDVLMIPGELFAREWFRPYEKSEFADVLAEIAPRRGT